MLKNISHTTGNYANKGFFHKNMICLTVINLRLIRTGLSVAAKSLRGINKSLGSKYIVTQNST